MSEDVAIGSAESDTIKLLSQADGTLYIKVEDKRVPVAKYDRTTGNLEWENEEFSRKYYSQAITKIGTVSKGAQVSGNSIKSFSIKGQAKPAAKVKRPKLGPLGDSTADVVQWYLDNAPDEAIIRYGIYTDANGKMIRRDVGRLMVHIVDNRETDDADIKPQKDGNKTQIKAPVAEQRQGVRLQNQIIARRATELTFTPNEVVGGFDLEEAE